MAGHPALDDRGLPRLAGKRPGAARKASFAATESYFEDQDLLSQWLTEECDAEPGNTYKSEATAELFASWTEFATRNGERPGSSKAFSAEMVKRGFERGTEGHAKVRCFKGVRLLRPLLRPRNGEDD